MFRPLPLIKRFKDVRHTLVNNSGGHRVGQSQGIIVRYCGGVHGFLHMKRPPGSFRFPSGLCGCVYYTLLEERHIDDRDGDDRE